MVKRNFLLAVFLIFHAVLGDNTIVAANTEISTPENTIETWSPASSAKPDIQDLHNEYSNIFRSGNRNAASHLWSNFVIQRANQMTIERFEFFMSGYCAISGSPIQPGDGTRYRLTLKYVGDVSTFISAFTYHCCSPCVCDAQEFVKVDTKNITTVDGVEQQIYFAVLGNPCEHPEVLTEPFSQSASNGATTTTLSETAPEIRCNSEGELEGAVLSDHGYVIIGMLFDPAIIDTTSGKTENKDEVETNRNPEASLTTTDLTPAAWTTIASTLLPPWDGVSTPDRLSKKTDDGVSYHDEREWAPMCKDRANEGFQSGMGLIFRKIASISPIEIKSTGQVESSQRNYDLEKKLIEQDLNELEQKISDLLQTGGHA